MRLPKINSLHGRIFAVFWITILLILIIVFSLPHLDPRKLRPLAPPEVAQLTDVRDNLEFQFKHIDNLSMIIMHLSGHTRHDRGRMRIFIADENGKLINYPDSSDPRLRAVRHFITQSDTADTPQKQLFGRYTLKGPLTIHLAGQPFLMYAGMQTNNPPPLFIQLIANPIYFLLLVMIVSTPLLLWLAWALSRPVNKFAQAAQKVAQGEFQVDDSLETGPSEFRKAGTSFNKMVEAVNGMISGQQRLLSDISHELRSPLTRLTMANALAKRKLGESPELERIDTEAQRLERMISELLELSRMQINSHMNREVQPLTSLWEGMLDDAQFEAEQSAKTLTYNEIPNRRISGTPKLLVSAVENVIRNAIKYGNTKIDVEFTVHHNQLHIRIEDDGPGVPENELNDIFRPFYRVSTSRDRNSGGTGLGLAITESAIRQHNGTINAETGELGGLKIAITLPIEP